MTKRIIYFFGKLRAKKIVAKVYPFLEQSQTIIDIGSGTGNVAELLKKMGKKVTPLDVQDLSFAPGITPIIYNGEKIPFPDSTFDAALLVCVLHHTKNPENLLKEAKRVAKKIIVVEDIYKSRAHKMMTNFFDSLLSLEFFKNPHSNKTDKEWRELLKKLGLELESSEYYTSFIVFRHALYSLLPLPR